MPARNNTYTVIFVGVTAAIFSCALALAATLLKPAQEKNVEIEIKKNILKALAALPEEKPEVKPGEPKPAPFNDRVLATFKEKVEALVVDSNGEVVPDADIAKIKPEDEDKKPLEKRRYPLYILKGDDGKPAAYAFPVEGKGLWSTLYGYLSLEKDLDTVRGITFYKDGETPGLGHEISADWFQKQFVGKTILDQSGKLVSVTVVKGKASEKYEGEELNHYVDGISGATLTSKGVTNLLKTDLAKYMPYFDRLRGKGGDSNG